MRGRATIGGEARINLLYLLFQTYKQAAYNSHNDAIASRVALIHWRRGMEGASESKMGTGMLMAASRPTKLLSQGQMRA
jgi:hypothetical protein